MNRRTTLRALALGTGILTLGSLAAPAFATDDVVLVIGRNSGGTPTLTDIASYWQGPQAGSSTDDPLKLYCSSNYACTTPGGATCTGTVSACSQAQYYTYDAGGYAWDDKSDAGPVCQLVHELYAVPGVAIAVVGHSAGGLVLTELLSQSAQGYGSQFGCSGGQTVDQAAAWVANGYTIAAPFMGSELANAVNTSWSWNILADLSCSSIVGSIANIFFDQNNAMTQHLTTSYMNANVGSVLGVAKNVYLNWGTSTSDSDSTQQAEQYAAQWCASMPGPNDGVVSEPSATITQVGNAKSSTTTFYTAQTTSIYFVTEFWAAQSHNSDRRCSTTNSNNMDNTNECFTQGFQYWNQY